MARDPKECAVGVCPLHFLLVSHMSHVPGPGWHQVHQTLMGDRVCILESSCCRSPSAAGRLVCWEALTCPHPLRPLQVLEMFILVLQQCHKENEDKWKRLSRQIADVILPMLARQQVCPPSALLPWGHWDTFLSGTGSWRRRHLGLAFL